MYPILVALWTVVLAVAVSEPIKPIPETAEEAAAQFWDEYVAVRGVYDFRLDAVRAEANPEVLEGLPSEATTEVRELVEECVAKVEAFEEQVAVLLSRSYSLEELVLLRDLMGTKFGQDYVFEANDWDDYLTGDFEDTKYKLKLVQKAIDSGLAKKFVESRTSFFRAINAISDPVIEYRDHFFPNAVFEAKEPYDSDLILSAPLEHPKPESLLRLFVQPMDCVEAYLQRERLIGHQIDLTAPKDGKRIGDQVVALVSFGKGKLDTQWIVKIDSVEKTEPERARSSNSVSKTRYTSFGSSYEFQTEVEAFRVQMMGPFTFKDNNDPRFEPKVSEFRILLKGEYLELGLDEAAAFIERFSGFVQSRSISGRALVSSSGKPFDEDRIAKTQQTLQEMNATSGEERAYAGSFLAYWEFFQVVVRTPQLRSILFKVAKLSPLTYFKYKKHGVSISYPSSFFENLGHVEALGELPVYSFPIRFSIDSKEVLLTRLIVTEPFPPLRNVAGIYGFVAVSPSDPTKRVVMRVLSTVRGVVSQSQSVSPE